MIQLLLRDLVSRIRLVSILAILIPHLHYMIECLEKLLL